MSVKFSFWTYGILAIAALAMVLYTTTSLGGYPDVGAPLLNVATFIVVAFVTYMFAKLLAKRF